MDVEMPNRDGVSAVEEIRKFDGRTPIVIQSNLPKEVLEEKFKGLSIQGYLDGKLSQSSQLEEQLKINLAPV